MSKYSVESAMGFDFSNISKPTQSEEVYFFGSDDYVKSVTESIESADLINLTKMIISEEADKNKRFISRINNFCENYIPKKGIEYKSCESLLDNCLISLEANVDKAEKKLNKSLNTKNMNGLQWFTSILKTVGLAAAVISGPAAVAKVLATTGIKSIIQGCISCDPVETGSDILKDPKCKSAIKKFKDKKGKEKMCSIKELKDSSQEIKSKAGFLNFILSNDTDSRDINLQNEKMICIKNVDGVTVIVSQLSPRVSSDFNQLFNKVCVLIVTAAYKEGNKIKTKNICRGYIRAGGDMGKSDENFKFIMDNYAHGQEEYNYFDTNDNSASWFKKALTKKF